jgi:F420-0:gamma-glutamyl ligase
VLMMGEGDEQTPLVIVKNAPKIEFMTETLSDEIQSSIQISPDEDLYAPFFQQSNWDFPLKKSKS